MKTLRIVVALVVSIVLNQSARAQQPIPIRTLTPPSETSTVAVVRISGLRELPGGRVLINDGARHQLLAFDASLTTRSVVLDSTPGQTNSYPRAGARLIAYRGDSSFFVDYDSKSLIVIEPNGRAGSAIAPPNPRDMLLLVANSALGADAKGRLLYQGSPPIGPASKPGDPPPARDMAPILRADFETHEVDTAAHVKVASPPGVTFSTDAKGKRVGYILRNPVALPTDDWTVMPDGTIAIMRGHDYHLDRVLADGTLQSSPKLPFDWRRITDEEKRHKVDSAQVIADSAAAAGKPAGKTFFTNTDGTLDSVVNYLKIVPAKDVPDFYPPIRVGSIKGDLSGNVWILPLTSRLARDGLLYDVINPAGDLIYRVQLPPLSDVAGFGAGGVVYVSRFERGTGYFIERRTIAP